MQKWLLGLGFLLSASFIAYVLYSSVSNLFTEGVDAANIFAALGMLGILLTLAATSWQRLK